MQFSTKAVVALLALPTVTAQGQNLAGYWARTDISAAVSLSLLYIY